MRMWDHSSADASDTIRASLPDWFFKGVAQDSKPYERRNGNLSNRPVLNTLVIGQHTARITADISQGFQAIRSKENVAGVSTLGSSSAHVIEGAEAEPLGHFDSETAYVRAELELDQLEISLFCLDEAFDDQVLQDPVDCLTNKYSEGMPDNRYYSGNEFIDDIENLCRSRAFLAYRIDLSSWGVNVQPYSSFPHQLCRHLRELHHRPRAHPSHRRQARHCRHSSVLLGPGQPALGVPSSHHQLSPDLRLDALDRQGCPTPNRP
ncbi:hypothetical protein MLD38_028226 [Melastoma candidum]|uniref:Uncharacterized protein n=1 Tax=Melastoma candidum TaxID=119954 RepID=A0ACB9N047_9MYRT|nr:hypothetical protein MLD38_028226 [Melastoma candidum]